jgi:biopolymer transport protein ExbD
LIFFLVNTSFVKETGVEVARPTASTASTQKKANILIAVNKDNRVFMDQHEIDVRAVRANVERELAENPESAVIVIADKSSDTGVAIEVMDGCRMAGAKNVSLAASIPDGS